MYFYRSLSTIIIKTWDDTDKLKFNKPKNLKIQKLTVSSNVSRPNAVGTAKGRAQFP